MYVATSSDRDWLLIEQKKLYARSHENPDHVFRKLWGFITDPRNLRIAFGRVARNRGRRTAGVDGLTVWCVVAKGVDAFVDEVALVGSKERIAERLDAWRESGATTLLVSTQQPEAMRALAELAM